VSDSNTPKPTDVPTLLVQLKHQSFYGSLEVKLEAGDVVLLKKTETIKLGCRDNRGQNVGHKSK
jgi:hypothetical protein